MWNNLKLFSVLIPALISVNAFFLQANFGESFSGYSVISLVFPVMIISFSWCGNRDLKRRWRRTLEAIAHLSRLEDLIGMHESIDNKGKIFKKDSRLFPRFYDGVKSFDKQKDFIEANIYKDNMYTAMSKVYWIFGIIGVILFFAPIAGWLYQHYLYLLTLG